jgi:phosphatidate cytidylyltransferase
VTSSDHQNRPGAGAASTHNLALRVASAAVLVPIAVISAFAGGWLFIAVCAIAAGVVLWEWTALVAGHADPRILVPGLAGLAIAGALIGVNLAAAAAGVIAIEAVLAALAAAAAPPRGDDTLSPIVWAGTGVLYAGVALLAPTLLRSDPHWGFKALLFLFAVVWITDVFAFFGGRAVGGPLLSPAVSPNKTWSGAITGLAGGVAAGVAVAYASGIGKLGIIGVMALVLSVLSQVGDLFESAVKRHFGVKDAGQLIPGHGGLMDRVDGFLFAALAALLIGIVHTGTAAPASGLLVW